jgi:CrcB protein
MAYLWIAVGSALGGVLRHWCSGVAAQLIGETFPWGTLIVNVAGSFAIGFFFTYSGPDGRQLVDPVTRQFVMVGICGGYTTFSSFSLQTLNLMRDGRTLAPIFSARFCSACWQSGWATLQRPSSARWAASAVPQSKDVTLHQMSSIRVAGVRGCSARSIDAGDQRH